MNFYANGVFTCDVAIVGAGPTGLTIANLLGKAGVSVIVIERNPSTVQAPRAVSIDDEALRTMQAAGLVDKVLENVVLDYGYQYITGNNVCLRRWSRPRANMAGRAATRSRSRSWKLLCAMASRAFPT